MFAKMFKNLFNIALTIILTSCSQSTLNKASETVTGIEPLKVEVNNAPNEEEIIQLFRTAFSLAPDDSIKILRVVTEDAGKFAVLGKMREIRTKIEKWNKELGALEFIGDDNAWRAPTWYADIEDTADMAYQINKLFLEYDKNVEMLFSGSYEPAVAFLEAQMGKSLFQLVCGRENAIKCRFRFD